MKKILWSMLLVAATAMVGCSSDDDNGGRRPNPNPTPETPSWCDYLFDYEFTALESSAYAIAEVDITEKKVDEQTIYELLGYDTFEDMAKALGDRATLDAAPTSGELCWFGIDGVTMYDIETPGNTNGFGHWYDANGSLTTWGDNARVYDESYFYNEEDGAYPIITVGIMPGVIVAGETYVAREVIVKNIGEDDEIRVGLQFTVTIGEYVAPELSSVGTKELELEIEYSGSFDATTLVEDFSEIATALGVENVLEECTMYGVNADGSLDVPTSNVWFDREGNVGSYGATASIDINYDNGEVLEMCNYPDTELIGNTYTCTVVFANEANQGYYIKVSVKLTEATVHEFTYKATKELTVTSPVGEDDDYKEAWLNVDFAEVAATLGVEDITKDCSIYAINADGSQGNKGTDFWFDVEGNNCGWKAPDAEGAENVAIDIQLGKDGEGEAAVDKLKLVVFPYPAHAGNTYNAAVAIVNADYDAVLVKVAATLTAAAAE